MKRKLMTRREIAKLDTIIRRVERMRAHTHDMILRLDLDHVGRILTGVRHDVETRKQAE